MNGSGKSSPNVSLVATVKNESGNVDDFLRSLQALSVQPQECIIVDGGSSDGTADRIRAWLKDYPALRLLEKPGSNIAEGRNAGIAAAKGPIIAVTDGGCRVHPEWLDRIVQPIQQGKAQVVIGWFKPWPESGYFARVAYAFLIKKPEEIDEQTLFPSGRSVAFTKESWEQAGGYPEELVRTGEDTLFGDRLRRHGYVMTVRQEAFVYWQAPATVAEFANKAFAYGFGDGQAGTNPYKRKIIFYLMLALILMSLPWIGWPAALAAILAMAGMLTLRIVSVARRLSGLAAREWMAFPWLAGVMALVLDVCALTGWVKAKASGTRSVQREK